MRCRGRNQPGAVCEGEGLQLECSRNAPYSLMWFHRSEGEGRACPSTPIFLQHRDANVPLAATAALRAASPSALRCTIQGRCHPTGSLSPDGLADTERGHEGVRALLSGSHRKVDERGVPRGDSAPGGGCRRAALAPPRPPPAVAPFARCGASLQGREPASSSR